jgi:hypothetical protein
LIQPRSVAAFSDFSRTCQPRFRHPFTRLSGGQRILGPPNVRHGASFRWHCRCGIAESAQPGAKRKEQSGLLQRLHPGRPDDDAGDPIAPTGCRPLVYVSSRPTNPAVGPRLALLDKRHVMAGDLPSAVPLHPHFGDTNGAPERRRIVPSERLDRRVAVHPPLEFDLWLFDQRRGVFALASADQIRSLGFRVNTSIRSRAQEIIGRIPTPCLDIIRLFSGSASTRAFCSAGSGAGVWRWPDA